MITDKQRQRDFEYEADYQTKSRYSKEQWANILESGQLDDQFIALIKEIYSSYDHVANLLQLSFATDRKEADILALMNETGQSLAQANDLEAEVDFSGNEYWWYLFFWGKEREEKVLELKLQPELSEAVGALWPELEEAYYAFAGEVDRSLQILYSQEDSVWIAAAVLLYEKYYRYPGISTDDILLMQYEVQTRAQKIFGQDVDTSTISQTCNADERGHMNNYLRDMYKYYRVSFPGEFDGDRERPDPQDLDYTAWIYSLFGYITLDQLYDFISHEYAHLVDDSYVELTGANGFVRLSAFLSRQGGKDFSPSDNSEKAQKQKADGADSVETFKLIGDALIAQYPNFTRVSSVTWYDEAGGKIVTHFYDRLYIESRAYTGAYVGIRTVRDEEDVHMETSLHLPWTDPEIMEDIRDKCDKLTLMSSAPFQVKEGDAAPEDLVTAGKKLVASALYRYEDYKTMSEEDIIGLLMNSLLVFASYYTDICQNYYPPESEGTPAGSVSGSSAGKEERHDPVPEDALRAALGDKLTYRPAKETAGPDIIYKEARANPTTDSITKTLQSYGSSIKPERKDPPARPKVDVSEHPDRSDQSFKLYPKNTLIQGPMKTGKFHEAIMTAVGIIEGKDLGTLGLLPVPDILEQFKNYEDQKRILHISCPDLGKDGYESFIENAAGQDGIFKEFANSCAQGRYVVLMEEADLNWRHLFEETSILLRENRREGASSESIVTLRYSGEPFRLPANLYLIATCDSHVCEDTILSAVDYDFYIRPVHPDPEILRSMRIEGISLERLMNTINMRISYYLGPDYQLGEGFYLGSAGGSSFASLGKSFREQIIPVLLRWFDGDIERIRYVLGDNAKSRTDIMFFQETPFSDHLFKGSLPDSFDRERRIYRLNEDAFSNPMSYITVYE